MAFVNIELDLHIVICAFLHPSDILTLRKTCKTLQFATKQRIVWMEALHRVCLENKLFLPSFPIPDMSDWELEQAAIRPRRWIELSTSLTTQGLQCLEEKLSPRIISSAGKFGTNLFLVPGGRYMVGSGVAGKLGVWDLGHLPSSDCKLIASVESSDRLYGVQATPDGMGLVICTENLVRVYEIYPQSETPQLTRIALILPNHSTAIGCLSPDKLIWYDLDSNYRIILRVWDYRLNTSTEFTNQVIVRRGDYNLNVRVTQTAIIVLYVEEVMIWDIPPLSPQPPTFFDDNLASLPPRIRVKLPDCLRLQPTCRLMSSWYTDDSQPLCLDKMCLGVKGSHLHRFKITIKPDLGDTTVHFVNTLPTNDCRVFGFFEDFEGQGVDHPEFSDFMICEKTLVSCWNTCNQRGIYIGSMLSHSTLHGDIKMLLPVKRFWEATGPFCPASGRYVYMRHTFEIVILDFLPHRGPDSGP